MALTFVSVPPITSSKSRAERDLFTRRARLATDGPDIKSGWDETPMHTSPRRGEALIRRRCSRCARRRRAPREESYFNNFICRRFVLGVAGGVHTPFYATNSLSDIGVISPLDDSHKHFPGYQCLNVVIGIWLSMDGVT